MIDVNSDTGRECLKLKEYPYNNALYSKNNTGRFNSRYIVLGHRCGLMILANGNFSTVIINL